MSKPVEILDHFRKPLWDSTDKRFIVCQGGAGSGKAVSLDTKVVTPLGMVEMKDIHVGDIVCDTEGRTCTVLNKWDNRRRMYDLVLEDGRTADVADNHQWAYYVNGVKREGNTLNILSKLNEGDVYLPLSEPVFFEDVFKYADVESLAYILLNPLSSITELPVDIENLKKAKLVKDSGKLVRNVPKEYMRLSVEDRVQLLHCLYRMSPKRFDSNTQELILAFKNKSIADKIQHVIWSLGGRCSCRNSMREGGFALWFDFDNHILKESISGISEGYRLEGYVRRSTPRGVRIKSLKQTSEKPCQCIEVDSLNHLYLINEYICTHNSEAICQRICYMFLTMEDVVFAVVRSTMPALTRSVYLGDPSIVKTLKDWGVPVDKWLNKTEYTIRNPLNNSVIYFIGLDDPEKIKSMNLNYIFIEEATEINADKWAQLNARLRRHNKYGKNQMFIAYNPISWYNWVVQMFVANPDENIKNDTLVHFSNFTQNPFVSIDNIKSMMARASQDESFYRTYIIGKPGKPLGLIYPNMTFTPRTTWPEGVWDVKPYYGIDWGFIDPMVLVECRDYNNKIYVICRYYETKKNTKEFLKFMEDSKVPKTANVYYDSADAERGSLLLQAGFTGFKAKKNINAGISFVKGFEIIVDSMGPYGQCAMDEVQAYTWQTDPNDSSKFIEKPIEINNHFCLIGETILNTENGRVMLKDVKVGDKVLSHLGYREVTDKCLTKKDAELFTLTLSNGYKLQGTGDHLIYTTEGFKKLNDISRSDTVIVCQSKDALKQQSVMEKSGTDIQIPREGLTEFISEEENNIFTDTFGQNITEKYQKGITSTILMKIQETTISQIWHSFLLKNIGRTTLLRNSSLTSAQKECKEIQISKRNVESGTNLKKDTYGTCKMESDVMNSPSQSSSIAYNVGVDLQHITTEEINFVQTNANQHIGENTDLIMRLAPVSSVETDSKSIDFPKQYVVQGNVLGSLEDYIVREVSVESVEPSGFGDVYSITVDEAHTYFANDILVKNCDALRYAAVTEHMYNRNFATATLDMSIEDRLRKSGVYFGDEKS